MKKIMVLSIFGLLLWGVMFLAGTDVWHFTGSPDFWTLPGAPYNDLRVFVYAFYAQFFFFLGIIGISFWALIKQKLHDQDTRNDVT